MKVIVISDTHHSVSELIHELKKNSNIDLMIHLGDFVKDAEIISQAISLPLIEVKGNCDWSSNHDLLEKEIVLFGRKILITHGHKYGVKNSLNRLYYKGIESKADIVLFGHTHVAYNQWIDGMLLFNPGSAAFPRGNNIKPSYGLLEISASSILSNIVSF
ncbi:MAG: metallophosphoesterase [Tissierellales bacterium]|nr:metallophosphoesterase [Tissierellales bacterium]MBN2826960.1 metallophosphoesterase [Tissierellales bacterium]